LLRHSTAGKAAGSLLPILAALVAGVLLAQLGGRVIVGSDNPPAPEVPIPSFTGDVDRDSRQDIVNFARALPFGESVGAGDAQPLWMATDSGAVQGAVVRIEPVFLAHEYTREELGNGRFVARMVNRDDRRYEPLGIGTRDTTYWWIDSIARGTWRTLLLSSDPAIPTVEMTTQLESTSGQPRHVQSLARWTGVRENVAGWVTCTATAGCRVSPPHE